ncbi:MAG: hypothetical protein CMF31_04020 [Kordiimonas sp.]|nr:hypothetical protein [Kordiimonas sp.]|tara:strand:+ start:397 stop:516 length:120 start_codon:yes stop_codon:yes gene_type:complete
MPLSEEHKKRAGRNYALALALAGFVALIFIVSLAKFNVI